MPGSRKANIIGGCTVLVILGLIAVVIAPFFLRGEPGIREPSCARNEHQIAMGLIMYASEYDDVLPVGSRGQGVGWAEQVVPYVKSMQVFDCPNDPTTGAPNSNPISYGYNLNVVRRHGRLSKVASSETMILVFEVAGAHADLWSQAGETSSPIGDGTDGSLQAGSQTGIQYATGYLGGRPPKAIDSQFAGANGRHSGGANYAFADGHVKWYRPNQVSSGTDAVSAKAAQTGTITGHAAGTDNPSFYPTFSTK